MSDVCARIVQTAALCLFAGHAAAHHSMAMYDFDREIILQGVVTTFEWASPHIYVGIETTDAAGETIVMTIEGPAPLALEIAGWSEDSLMPGDQVVVAANPSNDADRMMVLGNSVLLANGEALAMGGTRLQRALAGR